nr:MAG TPA: hypothetical protein [Caudoviricetes sp.]
MRPLKIRPLMLTLLKQKTQNLILRVLKRLIKRPLNEVALKK